MFDELPLVDVARDIEEVPDRTVGDAIPHRGAVAPRDDEVPRAQRRQVLGSRRLLEIELFLEVANGYFTVAQGVQNPNARRVPAF